MFGRDGLAFFVCRGHEGPFGQEVGPSEEAARALVDGPDGFITEQLLFAAGDFQVVLDIARHIFVFQAFEVASADDSGRQGSGGMEHELVDEVVLASQDDREQRFGIHVELA